MKKVLSVVLCLLLMCMACTAFAAVYAPGDTVTVTVKITSNSSDSPDGSIMVQASNSSVLQFVSGSGKLTMGGLGFSFAPQKDGASFALMSADTVSPIPTGTVGTVQYKIAENAAPGKYKINVSSGVFGVSGSVTVEIPCDHEYDKGKVTTEPTCEDKGVKTFTCSKCGGTKETDIEALGHDYDDGVQTKAPTCKKEGVMTFTCATCKDTYTEKIPKTDKHTWDDGVVTKEMTCLKDGEKTFTCSVCGLTDVTKIKAPGKHTYDESKANIEKEPTCTEDGKGSFTCTVCNEKIDGDKIPALGHDTQEKVTKEANCGVDGEKTTTCSRCDYKKVEKIPATGDHKYEEKVTTEPTCTEKGEKTFTCSVCGDKYTEKIDAKGHTPGDDLNEKKPTCTKPGYKYYTCSVCGADVKESDIPATGKHIYEVTEEVAPTCTENGKRVSKCTYEGCDKTKTETLKKLGHKMGEWYVAKAPTCTENGQEKRDCLNGCGKSDTRILKAAHTWGDWAIDEEAGTKTHVCGICGTVETKPLSTHYTMTVCSYGIRFRDLQNPITKDWYMFTPIDLSVEGEQTVDLIAGNMHQIGTATILVKEGKVTVTTQVNNPRNIVYAEEFLTFVPALADLTALDFEAMTNYAYGEEISIEEALGGDTKVLLLMRNRAWYEDIADGVNFYNGKGKAYNAYVESLKELMD